MKLKKHTLIVLLLSAFTMFSQEKKENKINGKDLFDKVYNTYSGKKTSTVILKDGSKIVGYKRDVDRKKGQIYYVKIKEESTGKKIKLNSEDIKEMYLYPGGLEKLTKIDRHILNVRQWGRSDLDNDVIKQGYIFFKNQLVSLKNKKKEKEYLMQLINPTFSKFIEVFGDPKAKETTKLGFGKFKVAGGLSKSYYIKKDGKIFWLHKKELRDRYDSLFGDCEEFVKKYPKKSIKWKYLSEYIFEYTQLMSNKS